MDREEAIRIFSLHPGVEIVHRPPQELADPGMVVVRFEDGEMHGFNPDALPQADPGESEKEFIARVHRHIDSQHVPGRLDNHTPETAVPAPRSARYYMPGRLQAGVVGWLSDFIGFGLALAEPDTLRMVMESELPTDRSELDNFQFQSRALMNLHEMTEGMPVSQMGLGPDVLRVTAPYGHEIAWFADPGYMQEVLLRFALRTHSEWAAIPARCNDLLLVNTETDQWEALLGELETMAKDRKSIHPVPYVVRDGRWVEHIPRLPQPLHRRFQEIKWRVESEIHSFHRQQLQETNDGEVDLIATFEGEIIDGTDDLVSFAVVPTALERTSIPKVDRVYFVVSGIEQYWTRFDDLRQDLPHLVSPHPGTHPPRHIISRPNAQDYARLHHWKPS